MADLDSRQTVELLRGQAIGAHTSVELNLCNLFQYLLRTDLETAGIVFYAIQNARIRNTTIEKLLKLRHGDDFSFFWNSWRKECKKIDDQRNSIAHWLLSTTKQIKDGVWQPPESALKHPTYRTKGDWHPVEKYTAQRLSDFADECYDLAFAIRLFHGYLADGDLQGREPEPLHDIFRQPIIYPIPSDSPLSRIWQKPETPPPPSGE